jgi:hypothetical protein
LHGVGLWIGGPFAGARNDVVGIAIPNKRTRTIVTAIVFWRVRNPRIIGNKFICAIAKDRLKLDKGLGVVLIAGACPIANHAADAAIGIDCCRAVAKKDGTTGNARSVIVGVNVKDTAM